MRVERKGRLFALSTRCRESCARVLFLAAALGLPEISAAQYPNVGVTPREELSPEIRAEMDAGRYWRASILLRERVGDLGDAAPPDLRLLLAEAEMGWDHWEGVVSALGEEGVSGAPARQWYLLGRARLALGEAGRATDALERFLDEAQASGVETSAALSLLARARLRADPAAAVQTLERLRESHPAVADWTALDAAEGALEEGLPAAAVAMLETVEAEDARERGWRVEMEARAAEGDEDGIRTELAGRYEARYEAGERGADLLERLWRTTLAAGDTTDAVRWAKLVLDSTTRRGGAPDAARQLWMTGADGDARFHVRMARALARGGEYAGAAESWDAAEAAGYRLTAGDSLDRARAHRYSGKAGLAVEAYRLLSSPSQTDAAIGARALEAWIDLRRRQERMENVRILEDRLLERYPDTPEAVDILFFRADAAHDEGRLDDALGGYREAALRVPSTSRAGLARMRWGQLLLHQGETALARDVFESYRSLFPDGRRLDEATFWAAFASEELGEDDKAEGLREELLDRSPFSYYATLIAGENFGSHVELEDGEPPPAPEWMTHALDTAWTLAAAGLSDGFAAKVAEAGAAAGSAGARKRLAMELHSGGAAIQGIRIGLDLRSMGAPWDRTLLRIVYPFPYRDLIESRALELEQSPALVAGIIRRESAFQPKVSSFAGAVGLMQVVPATGEALSRRDGPARHTNETLRIPEINVQLGTRYLADLMERYEGSLPLALSAYNAGPSRANRWRRFPEAVDPLRFTERIPFRETRDYVKAVVRYRALYRWLHGARE